MYMQHLARRAEDVAGARRADATLDRLHDGVDHVRRRLEDVGPHEVEQVEHRVLDAEADGAERHVLDGGARGLPVDEVAVGQRVLEQRHDE